MASQAHPIATATDGNFGEGMTKFFSENPDGFSEEKLKQAIQDSLAKTKTKTKETGEKSKRGRRTTKEPRDPNLPKRPKNAYMLFTDSVREEVKAQLVTASADGKVRVSEVSKVCGERWKAMSAEDKQPFVDANAEAKTDYEKAMEEYYTEYPDKKVEKASKKAGGDKKTTTKAKKVAFSTEDGLPTTPEGFSGAYTGYLKGSVKNPETGKNFLKKFADFNDAVVEAMRLGDACGGITRISKGYSLRAGTSVKENSNAGDGVEISWVKGDGSGIEAEVVSVDGPTSETASSTTTEEDFDAPTDDEGPPPLEEPEPDTEPVASPEPPAPVVDTPTAPQVKSIPITEDSDEDSDDEDDDEEVDAEEWTWKGVTYLVDDENEVMTEDGVIVGNRITIDGKTILKKC
jgi:hypothetical protein